MNTADPANTDTVPAKESRGLVAQVALLASHQNGDERNTAEVIGDTAVNTVSFHKLF